MTKRVAFCKDIGARIKSIREHLKMTLDEMRMECGLSRGYLSNFERGFKLPTVKYLKYLHDRQNVNLNYIFTSEGDMFRIKPEDKPPDFGKFQEEVDDLLTHMAAAPSVLYAVMGFFSEYKVDHEGLLKKTIPKKG